MARLLSGISFPFSKQGNGLPGSAKGTDCVRSDLIVLLQTPKRSRVMRPELGGSIYDIIFENEGPMMESMLTREIVTLVSSQMPMIQILGISIVDELNIVHVNISYMIQGIQDQTGPVSLQRAA